VAESYMWHRPDCLAAHVPPGDAPRPCTCARAERKRIEELESELREVKAGYALIDVNWNRHHEACMTPIRAATVNGTIPEILAVITHLQAAATILRAAGCCPPAMAQLNEENYQAWQAWQVWLAADRAGPDNAW